MKQSLGGARLRAGLSELELLDRANDPILSHATLATLQPQDEFAIIDVGANVGGVSLTFSKLFPKAQVYAVEADPTTYQRMAKRCAHTPAICPVNMAIHSQSGTIDFHSNKSSVLSSVIDLPDGRANAKLIKINAKTLDELVQDLQIRNVAVLKVDTEGNDLEVLKGADKLLRGRSLRYVICEFGIHPADARHVGINLLLRFMAQRGFFVSTMGSFGCHADYIYGNALFVQKAIHTGE